MHRILPWMLLLALSAGVGLRPTFRQDQPPPEEQQRLQGATVAASLMGPIAIEATAGNQ